jgi:hypothetical protein
MAIFLFLHSILGEDERSFQREIMGLMPYLFRQGNEGFLFRGISVKLLHEQTKEGSYES